MYSSFGGLMHQVHYGGNEIALHKTMLPFPGPFVFPLSLAG